MAFGIKTVHHMVAGALIASMVAGTAAHAHPQFGVPENHLARQTNDFQVHLINKADAGSFEKYALFYQGQFTLTGFVNRTVPWYYNPQNAIGAAGTTADFIDRLEANMQKWEAVCGIEFEYQGETTQFASNDAGVSQSVIGWGPLANGVSGVGGISGSVNGADEAQIEFGFVRLASNLSTVEDATILHELGHMIGIDHSDVSGAVMSGPPITPYTYLSELEPDDIAACQALYGAPVVPQDEPVIEVTPSSLAFDNVLVGQTSPEQLVTVANTGDAALALDAPQLDAAVYAVSSNSCGTSLAAGANCQIGVTFSPVSPASTAATLVLTHAAAPTTSTTVTLSGTGLSTPTPVVGLQPSALAFGDVLVGQTTTRVLTVHNTGTSVLTLGPVFLPAGVVVVPAESSCQANPNVGINSSCAYTLAFSPTAAGPLTGNVTVSHNGPNGTSIASVTGQAVVPAPQVQLSQVSLSFGNTLPNTPVHRTLGVTNSGNAPLLLSSFTISPGTLFEIEDAETTCSATVPLAAGESCLIQVNFLSDIETDAEEILTLVHNGANSPETVVLSARAVAASPARAVPVPANTPAGLLLMAIALLLSAGMIQRRATRR